jgi:TonB family protein
VNVWKNKAAVDKYGEKGKNGVIEITTKKSILPGNEDKISYARVEKSETDQKVQKDVFMVVEEMPVFRDGGEKGMMDWISSNIKYPGEAVKKGITGQVLVNFVVNSKGKIMDVNVVQSVNPLLDAEAIRVISSMPDLKPGRQGGRPVDVYMKIPIKFNLH